MTTQMQEINQFKGMRNDEDPKNIGMEYFFIAQNYNFPVTGLIGMEKILMPKQISSLGSVAIDGMFEYQYLDQSNVIQVEQIGVCNGIIYKDILGTPVVLKTGLLTGKCSFTVLNDRLFIANGKNFVNVYDGSLGVISEMGAPHAKASTTGVLTGTYHYAMTYVTGSGEEVLGTISNVLTVSNKKILLNLPIGYAGVTSRKLYRTAAGGTTLRLVTTIPNNTALTYLDNVSDFLLGALIPTTNIDLPKPYFVLSFNNSLIGGVINNFPTQIFITDAGVNVWDVVNNSVDISNTVDDSTSVVGLGIDFAKLIVGSKRHIYLLDLSTTPYSVYATRANVGMKDGYSVKRIPASGEFAGGLMFVSSLNDVRLMSGLQSLPVSTSLDNVRTENWAQVIRGTLEALLKTSTNLYAEFYDYKYHLIISTFKYVFDIRTLGWTYHNIQTENYQSTPNVLALLNGKFYNGQTDGTIEKEYTDIQYRSEDVDAFLESPQLMVDNSFTFIESLIFWLTPSVENQISIEVITDDNISLPIEKTFDFIGGAFSPSFFSPTYYKTNSETDYRVFNIYKPCRWVKYRFTNKVGNVPIQGFAIKTQALKNKE